MDGRSTRTLLFLGLAVLVAGALAFALTANAANLRGGPGFDAHLLRAMRSPADPAVPAGPPWLLETMRDLSALAGFPVLVLVVLAVAGTLVLSGQPRAALLTVAAVGGGFLLSQLLKGLVGRPRPAVVPALAEVTSSSFPSGHAMMAAVTYLTLGTLAGHFTATRALRVFCFALAVVVTFLVGVSRVYLGVHYPTDVLAGWAAGLAWAGAWWLGMGWGAYSRSMSNGT